MLYKRFGKLGWQISVISLGTYAIGGNWGIQDESRSLAAINRAIELGINFIDTADVYGFGKAERLLGNILKRGRSDIYLATKGGRDFVTNSPKVYKNFDVTYLSSALDDSLKRLQTDHIDLYQLHGPSVDVMKNGSVFEFLQSAKGQGKIRAAGVSVDSFEEVKLALQSGVIESIQYPFNVLEKNEGISTFELCGINDIAVIVREPLAQGLLTGKYNKDSVIPQDDHRSKKWTDDYRNSKFTKLSTLGQLNLKGKTLAQLSIQFIMTIPQVSTVIPGGRNSQQVTENVETVDVPPIDLEDFKFMMSL